RSRANAGYGPLYVRAELGTHGLAGEVVAAAMDGFEGDWTGIARDLVRRRFGPAGPADPAQRRKAADLLARRGFDGEAIRAATRWDPADWARLPGSASLRPWRDGRTAPVSPVGGLALIPFTG